MTMFEGYDPARDERLYKVFVYDKETHEILDDDILPEREIDGFLEAVLADHPNAGWGTDEY